MNSDLLPPHEMKLILETARELYPDNPDEQERWSREVIARRLNREPLQYLMGNQTFLSNRYQVGPGVLVPRPETEVLVDFALRTLPDTELCGLEIGAGSGAISIELLHSRPGLRITATEADPQALGYARKNAEQILGSRSQNLRFVPVPDPALVVPCEDLPESYDFLISNPPYLSPEDPIAADVLLHEPELALFPITRDPNYFYRQIALNSPRILKRGAMLFLEIPHQRADEIREIFSGYNSVQIIRDLTGRPRILFARL